MRGNHNLKFGVEVRPISLSRAGGGATGAEEAAAVADDVDRVVPAAAGGAAAEAALKSGQFDAFARTEIEACVRRQKAIGLDVLVYGEFEPGTYGVLRRASGGVLRSAEWLGAALRVAVEGDFASAAR